MNKIERIVYNMLRNNFRLKKIVRDVYQSLFDLLPVKNVECNYKIINRQGYFFGFHDKSPFSLDGKYLLAHKVMVPLRMPFRDDRCGIGYFKGENWTDYVQISTTTSWNWHQGAMLQWLGSDKLIFNDFDGSQHVSRVYHISGIHLFTFNKPVAAVSRDGRYGLSYSFVRSNRGMSGYGYANGTDENAADFAPINDGLYLLTFDSCKSEMLFSIHDLLNINPDKSMFGKFHWITHCQFSPDSKRFKFFHRWIDERTNFRWTRMFTCNIDGTDLYLFPTERMVSHVAWRGDRNVVAYARTAEYDDNYYDFDDRLGTCTIIGKGLFSSDGHPTFSADGRWMLTDTYPDRRRRQTLVLFDTVNFKRYDIARLLLPKQFVGKNFTDHWTVDLHPRFSRDDKVICFDCGYTGVRSLSTIDIGDDIVVDNIKNIKTYDGK